jgi:predicted nucleic acid-binding protein
MRYYIDTSVYLNLWKKEIDPKTGLKFWKITEHFLQKIEEDNATIVYSGFILKELRFMLGRRFYEKRQIFSDNARFVKAIANEQDYNLARGLEKKFNYKISFFDCMHIMLAIKEKAILVSRDKKLLEYAKRYCKAGKPEEFL